MEHFQVRHHCLPPSYQDLNSAQQEYLTPPFQKSTFALTSQSQFAQADYSQSFISPQSTKEKAVFQSNALFPASYCPQADPELPNQLSGEPHFEFIQYKLKVERLNRIH